MLVGSDLDLLSSTLVSLAGYLKSSRSVASLGYSFGSIDLVQYSSSSLVFDFQYSVINSEGRSVDRFLVLRLEGDYIVGYERSKSTFVFRVRLDEDMRGRIGWLRDALGGVCLDIDAYRDWSAYSLAVNSIRVRIKGGSYSFSCLFRGSMDNWVDFNDLDAFYGSSCSPSAYLSDRLVGVSVRVLIPLRADGKGIDRSKSVRLYKSRGAGLFESWSSSLKGYPNSYITVTVNDIRRFTGLGSSLSPLARALSSNGLDKRQVNSVIRIILSGNQPFAESSRDMSIVRHVSLV